LIRERFIEAGFEEAPANCPADIYVINTCTVTQKTDSESRRLIRNARKENPDSRIVVTGCYAELDADEIEKVANDLIIIKNSKKDQILQYLSSSQVALQGCKDGISRFEGRTKAFVKVQDGCDNFCSYCKVPLVRGRSRSRQIDGIISEIRRLFIAGYKEMILTGICLGDWGKGLDLSLVDLLSRVEEDIEGHFRIRLSSIEPWYVTTGLIKMVSDSKRVCKHFHIPMQSGDDGILRQMNRNFSSGAFIDLVDSIRSSIPEAAFTTDILAGFPGETKKCFENTLRVVESTRPSRVHIFPFSRRKGTKAYDFKEIIPGNAVKERINRLKSLSNKLAIEYRQRFVGKPVEVLVETRRDRHTGLLVGYTDTYIMAAFEGPDGLKGTIQEIRLPPLTNPDSYDILAAHLPH
jgi:threonylcarbamoyladenosine tRNA methylthiotransferase MtaB